MTMAVHGAYAGPLAVMINLASASASEIYSAAIQDYQRGIVIGSTTTGKGTAQVQLDTLAYGQANLNSNVSSTVLQVQVPKTRCDS